MKSNGSVTCDVIALGAFRLAALFYTAAAISRVAGGKFHIHWTLRTGPTQACAFLNEAPFLRVKAPSITPADRVAR